MLNQETVDVLQNRIAIQSLPKTFQEAITIAYQWFNCFYIWIDSLCIMQDSINDWEHEAPLMREVYKNGLVTIAATGAHNSSEGCFFERYPGCVKPLKVAATLDVLAKGVFYCVDKDMWARGVERSPIGRRAWVIQEVNSISSSSYASGPANASMSAYYPRASFTLEEARSSGSVAI